jgi:hypothetical protein
MGDNDQTSPDQQPDQQPDAPGPTGWDRKQNDIGAALFLGGVVVIVLLAVLIGRGLF